MPDATTADPADPTVKGKSGDGQELSAKERGGLNRSLNEAVEAKKVADAEVKRLTEESSKATNLERENKELKVRLKYPDVAEILQRVMAKDVNPDAIDDDFVAILRAGVKGSTADDDDTGTPAHNPPRKTSNESPADQLKAMTTIFSD